MSPSRTTTKNATRWVVVLTAIGSLMAALDTLVVATALNTIRVDLGASVEQLEWTVNAYNLSFAVLLITGAALGDRFGRRNLYAAGLGPVRGRLGRVRAGARRRLADRRPRGPGRRRRARHAARVRAAERRLPARAARRGDRPLQRDHRDRRRHRPARRRRRGRGHRLGVDLLDQRPDRPRRGPARADEDEGEPRPRRRPRPPRPRAGHRRRARASCGGSCAATRPAGAAPRSSARSPPASLLVAAFVAWELRAREPMLPHAASSARARSRPATRRSSSRSPRCSPAVFFFAQLLQTGLGYGPLGAGLRLMPWTATFITVAPVAGALADRYRRAAVHGRRARAAGGRAWPGSR